MRQVDSTWRFSVAPDSRFPTLFVHQTRCCKKRFQEFAGRRTLALIDFGGCLCRQRQTALERSTRTLEIFSNFLGGSKVMLLAEVSRFSCERDDTDDAYAHLLAQARSCLKFVR